MQGSMFVKENAAKFMELSQFAPYLIPNEEKKARKFEEGLQPWIFNLFLAKILEIWLNWWNVWSL